MKRNVDTSFAVKAAYFSFAISSQRTVATMTYTANHGSIIKSINNMQNKSINRVQMSPYGQVGQGPCSP